MVQETEGMSWEAEYPATAVANLLRFGMETLARTLRFYEVRNPAGEIILNAGVALWSFSRPPELWIVMAKPFLFNLRESLRLSLEAMKLPAAQYEGLVCDVARDNRAELHFVYHLGCKPTGRPSLRPDGDKYIQFGVY